MLSQQALLKQGWKVWNAWYRNRSSKEIDLSGAILQKVDLSESNLNGIDLSEADLREAGLIIASLTMANLSKANLSGALLVKATCLMTNFSEADLSRAKLSLANLNVANLEGADLREADLSGADLRSADLRGADLRGANFYSVQALHTDFTGAKFTGAYIEDWNINSETKLDDVECEYIYLKYKQERRPSDPNRNFEPGEFKLLVQKAFNTVDLIFRNGIDWQALLISLEKLRVEAAGAELYIQAIENKNDGTFVVRVNTPPEADKAEVEKFLKREYDVVLKMLEAKYESQLQLQGEQLVFYREELTAKRQENTRLMGVIEIMAENQAPKYDMRGSNFGNFIDTAQAGSQQSNIQFITTSQDLSQAAQQIQALLNQLQKNGVSVEVAQEQAATDLAKQAKADPTFKGKLVKWSETMANKASETTVSEAVKAVVSLAMKMLFGI